MAVKEGLWLTVFCQNNYIYFKDFDAVLYIVWLDVNNI